MNTTVESETAHLVPLWRGRNLVAATDQGQQAVYLKPGELNGAIDSAGLTLLGTDGKRHYFALPVSETHYPELLKLRPDARFVDLRLASVDMDAKHAGVLAYAKALLYWQYRHQFCGACGSPNLLRAAGHKLECSNPECARESFPRIDPAIIVLVTHGDYCLLARAPGWPDKRYSTLAGFVEPGESLEDAVAREVHEEVGVELGDIRYVSSQPWPFPASAMCGFYAEALGRDIRLNEEIEQAHWLTAMELKSKVLDGSMLLSSPVSIAFRLLTDWYRQQCGENLEQLVRSV